MTSGDQQNGGTPGWAAPGQEPQDAVPQWQSPYPESPQYPQQAPYPQPPYPQPPYQQAQPPYPQQPYQQWQVQQQGRRSGGFSALRAAIISGVGVLIVVGIVAAVLVSTSSSGANIASTAPAGSSADPAATAAQSSLTAGGALPDCATAPAVSSEPIGYHACGTASRDVGVPTYDAVRAKKNYVVTMKTNRGDIVFAANGNAAPYTVYSFVYLAEKQYFANTICHRLTTAGIFVLQCGDPSGTGSGGPGYAFQDENLASLGTPDSAGSVTYKTGVVAMANAGPDTNGSQFFLVYKDSPIPPSYTPFGTITKGLDIIQEIAKAGTDNSYGSGDGTPNDAVRIESVTVQ